MNVDLLFISHFNLMDFYFAAQPILYSYFRSSCSWRVRIGNVGHMSLRINIIDDYHDVATPIYIICSVALYWKGIDYDYKAVHLVKGEQVN